jgi:type I restriction enzyme S subunit
LNTEQSAEFHYYNLLNSVQKIKNRGEGTTFLEISKFELERLKFFIPDFPTQSKIASVLSTLDAQIEKTEAIIAKYQAIKEGMLHDLFTRGIDINTGRLRPVQEHAPELYKTSELGMIPKDWEVRPFEKVCSYISDGAHFSPKPIEEGKIIGNVKDMEEYGINYDTCTRISLEEYETLKKQNCAPKMNDILFSKDGTIGKVLLFDGALDIVVLSSIAIIRSTKDLEPRFLYSFLKSEHLNQQLLIKTSGSALKRIVLRDIRTLLITLPADIKEQSLIGNRVTQLESKLKIEQSNLRKMQQIKQGLLVDLLSGNVKVKLKEP